jgi:hypothetical protein
VIFERSRWLSLENRCDAASGAEEEICPMWARTSPFRRRPPGPVAFMSEAERLWVWRRNSTDG